MTRACSLACRHCRAQANLSRHPLELTTEESFRFIEHVERCRPTLFVMTGGDPIRRLNLEALVRHATDRGLRVSLSPSATPEFACADLGEFKTAGVERISLSLDGASRETHDRFRGVPGVLLSGGEPGVLLSGGEPLIHPCFFDLAAYARGKGLRLTLSTNGTLIHRDAAQRIKDTGFAYVGISLDGIGATPRSFSRAAGRVR